MARVSLCVFCFYLDCLTLTEGHPDKGWALLPCGPGLCLAQMWMLKLQSAESWLPSHRRQQLPPAQQVSLLSALVPKPQLPVSLKKIKKLKGSSRLQSDPKFISKLYSSNL